MQQGGVRVGGTPKTLRRSVAVLGTIAVAALTFALSSGLAHRGVSHGVSIAFGVSIVLSGLSTAMREISAAAQRWTTVLATGAVGVSLGFLVRLLV